MIVVDANVIAYFIVPGDITKHAEAVREKDPHWSAPKLWRYEMRNLLTLYVRSGALVLDEVRTHMANAERLLTGREYDVLSDGVLSLAAVSGCTAYDCEFVYLAERLSIPLVTSDNKLLMTFPKIAVSMTDFIERQY